MDPLAQALGLYRGNLVVLSSGEFQAWKIDPDPALMALLDNIPSIGTPAASSASPEGSGVGLLPMLHPVGAVSRIRLSF